MKYPHTFVKLGTDGRYVEAEKELCNKLKSEG